MKKGNIDHSEEMKRDCCKNALQSLFLLPICYLYKLKKISIISGQILKWFRFR